MTDSITITFNCPDCGGKIVWDENAPDTALSRCDGCGQDGPPIGDLKRRAMDESKAHVQKMMRDAFKGVKGWKFD